MNSTVPGSKPPPGLQVAIVPFPALGDLTIYLRLSQTFVANGAQVTYFSDQLAPAASTFPWLEILPLQNTDLPELLSTFDLVVWDAGLTPQKGVESAAAHLAQQIATHSHLAVVTAKKLPSSLRTCESRIQLGSATFGLACTTFCLDSKAGLTMVDWVDRYATKTFNLTPPRSPPEIARTRRPARKAIIFPTTPNPRKNYWPLGFRAIAKQLLTSGWEVTFVSSPNEQPQLETQYAGYAVKTFPDLNALIAYMDDAGIIVSNDSGGGHLASMLGLPTVTITRKPQGFTWRPGFNRANAVLSPPLTFKIFGSGHIWRPFIPFWRVLPYAEAALRHQASPAHPTNDASV